MAHEHTFITKNGLVTKKLTASQAIRQKCLECCGWYTPEVKHCEAKDCALHPFRMGRAGNKLNLTEKQRACRINKMKK